MNYKLKKNMSSFFNDNVKSKPNLNLYNIEPNSLIALSFNFDILKYVITELINNQKNTNNEISKLKSEWLRLKKFTNEIESSSIELKLSSGINFDIKKNLEEKKNRLNMELNQIENEIKNKENNEVINIKELINEESKDNLYINKEKVMNAENIKTDSRNFEINKEDKDEKNNNYNDTITLKEETKIFDKKKISYTDQGINSEEIYKIINEIKDLKSMQLNLEKDFIEYKKENEKNFSKKFVGLTPNNENNLISQIKIVEETLNEKIKKNVKDINNNINNMKEEYDKINKEINKKLSEKEITYKIISELQSRNDILTAKVNTLNDNFSFYTKLKDFKQNKEDILEYIKNIKEDINRNVEILRRSHNSLKSLLADHLDDKTDHNNLDLLLKRFDIAQNMIYKFRDFQNIMEEKEKKRIVIDPNHFIDRGVFDDFLKSERKNFDEYKKEVFNIKQDLQELKNKENGDKATLKDLKSLEDNILQRIEEFKQTISKKFVDKNTLDKNKKIIEMQTKQLIEEKKKEDKKDNNWLLSKKPFSGHLCASCESFIGELNPNVTGKFIPWNKYPQKDLQEKVFKIEGGTSKLLNLFSTKVNNINNNYNKNNINYTSLNNSTSVMKTNDDDNDKLLYNSRNCVNENLNVKNKFVQVSSFSSRLRRKKNYEIKSEFDELENLNNLPMISRSIKNIKRNNSSFNLLNSDISNKKTFKNMLNSLTSSNSPNYNKNSNNNLHMKSIQIEDDEELNRNSKKNNSATKENRKEKSEEPKITKIIKKH